MVRKAKAKGAYCSLYIFLILLSSPPQENYKSIKHKFGDVSGRVK